MFGYVRPYRPELKLYELEWFKACYCGLCHRLRKRYGFVARFILNYDFTFLSMLLWRGTGRPETCMRRCPASPFRRRCTLAADASLDLSAGYSLILAWWKLKDSAADESAGKALAARLGTLALRRGYRKACRDYPEFDAAVRERLQLLAGLEREKEPSLDRAADCFAALLAAASATVEPDGDRRAAEQLLYHLGRWIYLTDALDDLPEDLARGRYNPIAARYALTADMPLQERDRTELSATIAHSANLAGAALELLPESPWSGILRNTIYLGLPYVVGEVLAGRFQNTRSSMKKLQTGDSI